ncbi:MAG: hypothetical protein HY735_13525 [Verrucomicrobia bacterium]|nr:hypothetical protein [Verrucomicrobiota bacterium]
MDRTSRTAQWLNRQPYLEWLVLGYAVWQSQNLLAAWLHNPFDRWGWLAFLIWLTGLVVSRRAPGDVEQASSLPVEAASRRQEDAVDGLNEANDEKSVPEFGTDSKKLLQKPGCKRRAGFQPAGFLRFRNRSEGRQDARLASVPRSGTSQGCTRFDENKASACLLMAGLTLTFLGDLGSFKVSCNAGLALILLSFASSPGRSLTAAVTAVSWMPAMGWFGSQAALGPMALNLLRVLLALLGVAGALKCAWGGSGGSRKLFLPSAVLIRRSGVKSRE